MFYLISLALRVKHINHFLAHLNREAAGVVVEGMSVIHGKRVGGR